MIPAGVLRDALLHFVLELLVGHRHTVTEVDEHVGDRRFPEPCQLRGSGTFLLLGVLFSASR